MLCTLHTVQEKGGEADMRCQIKPKYFHHMTCINISSSGVHTFVHDTPWFAGKAPFTVTSTKSDFELCMCVCVWGGYLFMSQQR